MSSTPDPRTLTLADFPVHRRVTTRWSDNDMYGHLNNGLFVDPEHTSTPDPSIKALGHWVHVEIDTATRRPTPIPDHLRGVMETAVVEVPA